MDLVRRNKRDLFDPMRDMNSLQDEINKLFDFTYPDSSGLFDRSFSPAVDIIEKNDTIEVVCDLPGVDKDDLELSVASNVLTIKGEKKEEKEKKEKHFYKKETWNGSFQRTIPLPDAVDPDKVEANMKNGVLTIELAKKEEVKPKQISVNVK